MKTHLRHKVTKFCKKHTREISAAAVVGGLVLSNLLTAKNTVKAVRIVDKMEEEKGAPLTNKETFKAVAPLYIPTVSVIAGSAGVAINTCVREGKQLKAIQSAIGTVNALKEELPEKQTIPEGTVVERGHIRKKDEPIVKAFDVHSNTLFETTRYDIQTAKYELNRKLAVSGIVSYNDWRGLLGLKPVDTGYHEGWSVEQLYDWYPDNIWIEVDDKQRMIIGDDEVIVLRLVNGPISYYLG